MKNLVTIMTVALIALASCADDSANPDKDSGEEQIQGPVTNSGPRTETQRAIDAVRDSSVNDSANRMTGDSGAHSLPH